MDKESRLFILQGLYLTQLNSKLTQDDQVYSSASRELKGILDNLNLYPSPTIIDVDIRDDAEVLLPVLKRLLPFSELPVLLIGGRAVGSTKEVHELEKSGELQKLITASGSTIDGAKRKKNKK